MENLQIEQDLDCFVEAIDSFPASDLKSMFYDSEKLLSIREFDLLKTFFGEKEHNKALRNIHKIQEAVKACKAGDLEYGFTELEKAYENAKSLTENAYQYVQLYYLSGIAYYYYRKGEYEKALELTWAEISETEKLETKGAISLHYRRVGHIYNAIKLLQVSGNYEQAANYALGDLLYTLNGDTSLLPNGQWNVQLFDFIKYLRQRHFDKSFLSIVEMALEKQVKENEEDSLFYDKVFTQIPEFEVTNNNLAMIYNWLYLQKEYNQKEYSSFIKNTIEYCQVPFDYTFDILKLSLLSKVILLLKRSEIKHVKREKMNVKINDYIQNKLQSKQPLKENVCYSIFE